MKKYKITLWRNDYFCNKSDNVEHCTYDIEVEAETPARATHIALQSLDVKYASDLPIVYEITEL